MYSPCLLKGSGINLYLIPSKSIVKPLSLKFLLTSTAIIDPGSPFN